MNYFKKIQLIHKINKLEETLGRGLSISELRLFQKLHVIRNFSLKIKGA